VRVLLALIWTTVRLATVNPHVLASVHTRGLSGQNDESSLCHQPQNRNTGNLLVTSRTARIRVGIPVTLFWVLGHRRPVPSTNLTAPVRRHQAAPSPANARTRDSWLLVAFCGVLLSTASPACSRVELARPHQAHWRSPAFWRCLPAATGRIAPSETVD